MFDMINYVGGFTKYIKSHMDFIDRGYFSMSEAVLVHFENK